MSVSGCYNTNEGKQIINHVNCIDLTYSIEIGATVCLLCGLLSITFSKEEKEKEIAGKKKRSGRER